MSGHDEESFTAIFHAHRDVVFGYLLGRTSDREAALDLLQETFLRVWRRIDEVATLDADRQRGWTLTVARNLAIDRYRTEASRAHAVRRAEQHARAPDLSPQPEEHAQWRGHLDALDAAIARLPEEQRTILAMATVGELSSAEIGAALGQPAGTIRYKLHQARARLATQLDLRQE